MRMPLLAFLLLAAAPAPAQARASLLERAGEGPAVRLEVPALALHPARSLALARDGGSGAPPRRGRGGNDPILSLILGIIPGFGLGHVLADSDDWPVWLVVDVVIAVAFWGPFFFDTDRGTIGLLNVLVVVERVLEGVDAYRQAQGRPGLFGSRDLSPPAFAAIPEGGRRASAAPGLRF